VTPRSKAMAPELDLLRREGVADSGVLTLGLNRPARLNAIDEPLAQALLDALTAAMSDDSVRAIVLRGEGRAFCAGRDISRTPTERDLELAQAVATTIVHGPKPVIAAVHGWVVGAGLEWMLATDIVIAADDARLKLPEAGIGVFVTGGVSATLAASVGVMRAKALMLLGDAFTAADAQRWGLVWNVVPREQLDGEAQAIALRLAALDTEVASRFKRVLNQIGLHAFDRAVAVESAMQRQLQARM
jgi:2-(1,2-epoxy-1,2-dihydrophenyl)acetyl-CoA isomerase